MLTDPEIMQSAEFIGAAKLPNFSFEFCGYANVYAALLIMALLCAGIIRLLFVVRDRLLNWQEGFI